MNFACRNRSTLRGFGWCRASCERRIGVFVGVGWQQKGSVPNTMAVPFDGASTGYGFTVGTVAQLIAQGPSQPCAGCKLAPTTSDGGRTMPRKDGLFSQRGWVVLCGRHLQARRDEASSFAASTTAPVPMPTLARPQTVSRASRAQQPVVSISSRWKRQVKKQQRRQQKRDRTSAAATGDSPTGALLCETTAAIACQG